MAVSRRSFTGCITCRIRKVKCDEEKPACQRCLSTGRSCDGYSSIPFSRDELRAASQRARVSVRTNGSGTKETLVQTLISDSAFRSATEKRYFQLFQHCTIKHTNVVTDSRFWDRIVLQASYAEPAIKHAVLALSAYHSFLMQKDDVDASSHHRRFADEQYLRALGEAKQLVTNASSQQIERVLITCMLFIIYEGLRGNYAVSQAHMDNARAITSQNHRALVGKVAYRSRTDELFGMMARLDVLTMNFSDMAAPYHYDLEDFKATLPILRPVPFSTIQDAAVYLFDISRWITILAYEFLDSKRFENISRAEYLESEMISCKACFVSWKQEWQNSIPNKEAPLGELPALNIECWSIMVEVMLNTGLGGSETKFDQQRENFERLVDSGEKITAKMSTELGATSLGLDLGFLIPMFFAAIRCRDPFLRRRAITVMRSHDRREGVWGSKAAAAIAMRWVQAEELGVSNVRSARDIPVEKRITSLNVEVDTKRSSANLQFHSMEEQQGLEGPPPEQIRWSEPRTCST